VTCEVGIDIRFQKHRNHKSKWS